jgi:hypothetical protein
VQKEIGDKLLERYDKNLDRFISLLQLVFVIVGLYSSIVIHYGILGEIAKLTSDHQSISYFSQPVYLIIFFIICLASILFAVIALISQIKIAEDHRFKKIGELIQFREGEEIEKFNLELFLSINNQRNCYTVSILLITCSVFSVLGYCYVRDPAQQQVFNFIVSTLLLVIIVITFIISIFNLFSLMIWNKVLSLNLDTLIACLFVTPVLLAFNFNLGVIFLIFLIIMILSMIYKREILIKILLSPKSAERYLVNKIIRKKL